MAATHRNRRYGSRAAVVLLGAFLGLTVAASGAVAYADAEPAPPAAPATTDQPATAKLPAQPKRPAALAAVDPAPVAAVLPAAEPTDPTPPPDPTSTTASTTTTSTPPPPTTTPPPPPNTDPAAIGSASWFAAPAPLSVEGQVSSRRSSRGATGRAAAAGAQLPFTGSGTLLVLVCGLGALAIGGGAVWWGTRSRPSVDAPGSSSTG